MTTSNPEPKLNYVETDNNSKRFYVRHNGFHIGMVWSTGGAWGGSRYNDCSRPEVKGETRKQCATKLVELTQAQTH